MVSAEFPQFARAAYASPRFSFNEEMTVTPIAAQKKRSILTPIKSCRLSAHGPDRSPSPPKRKQRGAPRHT
jgi:hypothetical protein